MSGGGKGHIAAGGLAMIGMVIARAGDTCASAGSRAARGFDDVAAFGGVGSRAARGFGDATELGMRRLGDDAWLHPSVKSDTLRLARRADPAEATARVSKLNDDEVLGDVAEFAGETAWNVTDIALEFDDDRQYERLDPRAHEPRPMSCPTRVDISHDRSKWARMVSRGDGARCSPWVVFGVAAESEDGEPPAMAIRMGRSDTSSFVRVEQLAADCWSRGLSCVFVGCEEWECQAEVPKVFPTPVNNVTLFTSLLAKQLTLIEHTPAFVAVVRGDRSPRLQRLTPKAASNGETAATDSTADALPRTADTADTADTAIAAP